MKKKNGGITLIALVITIIVLLILVGVTLNLVTGSNGIIGKAEEAVMAANKANAKEELEFIVAVLVSDYYEENDVEGKTFFEYLKEKLNNYKTPSGGTIECDEYGNVIIYCKNGQDYSMNINDTGTIIEKNYDKWDGKTATVPIEMNETEIHIYKATELKWLADQVNAGTTFEGYTIYLENDLDFGARKKDGNWETNTNEKVKWEPIGNSEDNMLKGTFDGNGHIITGIYVNKIFLDDEVKSAGLFGFANSIKNLIIKNGYVKGESCTGGLCGRLFRRRRKLRKHECTSRRSE